MRTLPLLKLTRLIRPTETRGSALRVATALAAIVLALASLTTTALAQDTESETDSTDAGFVEVIEISGLLDPVVADALEGAIDAANQDGARHLILQLNSRDSVVSDERLNELAIKIGESVVPIDVWVGPSGSRAGGGVAQLVSQADSVGVSIGSTIGDTGPQVLDVERFGPIWGENHALLESTALNWEQAVARGIVDCELVAEDARGNTLTPEEQLARCANPTIGEFLIGLDGFDTEVIEDDDGIPRLAPVTQTRLRGLSLLDQFMHTVASPSSTYLLLVIGLGLLIFEFFSIGIGIAGVIGAVILAMGGYGLGVLPFRMWALVLILLSMLAFAIDVQTAVPRAWTIIGIALFTIGTVFLFPFGPTGISWIPIVVGVLGFGIVMLRGMPLMVRGRFSTTLIDRGFLNNREATAVQGFADGDGLVALDGVQWPAHAACEVGSGDPVRVTGVREHVLTVEPVR